MHTLSCLRPAAGFRSRTRIPALKQRCGRIRSCRGNVSASAGKPVAHDEFVRPSRCGNGDSEENTGLRARDSWFNGMHAPIPGMQSLRDADLYGTLHEKHVRLSPEALIAMYADVRDRTIRSLGELEDTQLVGEMESSLNPMIWAVGHNAHFYETMVVRLLWPNMQVRAQS